MILLIEMVLVFLAGVAFCDAISTGSVFSWASMVSSLNSVAVIHMLTHTRRTLRNN